MTGMKGAPVAAVIGDLVGSRAAGDRRALHRRLADALEQVNAELEPRVPLRITVGDEYQGIFDRVGAAAAGCLALRLALWPDVDVRHGIGWGTVTVLDEEPRVEDGPGWWAARDAIEAVATEAERAASWAVRTGYRRAEGVEGPDPYAVGAALGLYDQALATLPERSVSVLRDLLAGRSQREIAERAGISPSAVSQRVRRDGLALLVSAAQRLEGVR